MSRFKEALIGHEGPPVEIEGVIRALGIGLNKKAALDPEISGQIEVLNGEYKISVNKDDHYYRQRFTMAHELGHFLYHAHLINDGVDDNRAYRSTPDGRFYNRKITAIEETEANQFAASVLMPLPSVIAKFEELDDALTAEDKVKSLAKMFQVSAAAMKIRLRGAGLTL